MNIAVVFMIALTFATGCSKSSSSSSDSETADSETSSVVDTADGKDTIADTDTDVGVDTDSDTDTDSDSDTDTDIDTDTDTNTDTDTDTDTDVDTDLASDSSSHPDVDTDVDTASDTDSDSDSNGGVGTDTDTDTIADTLRDSESESGSLSLDPQEIEEKWVTIPSGQFMYGSPDSQPCRGNFDEEQVEVIISRSFKMAATEITRKEWLMTGFPDPSKAEACDDCPQGWINWYDTLAWLNALSSAAGLDECYDLSNCAGTPASGCPDGDWYREVCWSAEGTTDVLPDLFRCSNVHKYNRFSDCPGYRLPTEAEWEWAARGETTTATYNGDFTHSLTDCTEEPVMEAIGWYCGNTETPNLVLKQTAQLQPNAYGLFDILGNASEWVDGIYTGAGLLQNNGGEPPLEDPNGETDESTSLFRSRRGGSITLSACRCAATTNGYCFGEERAVNYGFRPVRTLIE